MRDDVTISHRGASYQIGRGPSFYGIWAVGATTPQPIEWWPDTPEGWYAAWSRFASIEVPGTIMPVAESHGAVAGPSGLGTTRPLTGPGGWAPFAAALILVGVVCGVVGLFPDYLDGASLAQQPPQLVPHAIYLATWSLSALLILLGGSRLRLGALLGMSLSVVTFGFYFADAGTAISAGAHVMGAGLVLGLVGWLACAAGSTIAFVHRPAGKSSPVPEGGLTGGQRGFEPLSFLAMALGALGAAAAFAPSWDSFILHTSAGATQSLTAGNVFSNPAPVIAGNLAVMVSLVAVVIAAALWRPVHQGALLMAGAVIPMVAQAISALVQVREAASPTMLGISPSSAAQAGLTITSGLTLAFWIYCAFVLALVVTGASTLIAPRSAGLRAAPPAGNLLASDPPSASSSGVTPPGLYPFGPVPPNKSG